MDIKERIQDLTLDQKAKLYFMGLLRKGLIDTLPEDPKAAYIRDMMDKKILEWIQPLDLILMTQL